MQKKWQQRNALWYTANGLIVVPDDAALRDKIIAAHHDSPYSGHQGRDKTAELVTRRYWWYGVKQAVAKYCAQCHHCQMNKSTNTKPAGKLVPLQVPDRPWASISVDFITGLPKCSEMQYNSITVFVDRFTKMVHYVPCRDTMSAEHFAQLFLQNVFRLHGLPLEIISDRDPKFTSKFWREVTAALDVRRCLSTAFHPQSDGQTERMNRTLEEMLRHYITPLRGDWVKVLPILEFAYNNAHNSVTKTSPFKLYTNLQPLCPNSTLEERTFAVPDAKRFVSEHFDLLQRAKQYLLDAQSRMKSLADRGRRDLTFKAGDLVSLSTKHLSLQRDDPRKTWPKRIGPLQ
jgi:hypothetical protein